MLGKAEVVMSVLCTVVSVIVIITFMLPGASTGSAFWSLALSPFAYMLFLILVVTHIVVLAKSQRSKKAALAENNAENAKQTIYISEATRKRIQTAHRISWVLTALSVIGVFITGSIVMGYYVQGIFLVSTVVFFALAVMLGTVSRFDKIKSPKLFLALEIAFAVAAGVLFALGAYIMATATGLNGIAGLFFYFSAAVMLLAMLVTYGLALASTRTVPGAATDKPEALLPNPPFLGNEVGNSPEQAFVAEREGMVEEE
jgi:MFS family permease